MKFLNVRLILTLCLILFVVGCVGPTSNNSSAANGGLETSQLFTLKNLSGEAVDLGVFLKDHKAVLVNFWATWCPPCREEIPGLISLQKQFGGQKFTILGVNIGESNKKVSIFAGRAGINYPVVLDEDMRVAESYKVVGIPTSFLIGTDGKILGVYHAYTSELSNDVEKALR